MKKLIVIIVVVVVVAAGAAWFYLREPAGIPAPAEKLASPELVEGSFDANDNLDQALDDLRVFEETGIE